MGSSRGQVGDDCIRPSWIMPTQRIAQRRRPNQESQRITVSAEISRMHHNVVDDCFDVRPRCPPVGHRQRKLSRLCRSRDSGSTWFRSMTSAINTGGFTANLRRYAYVRNGLLGTVFNLVSHLSEESAGPCLVQFCEDLQSLPPVSLWLRLSCLLRLNRNLLHPEPLS